MPKTILKISFKPQPGEILVGTKCLHECHAVLLREVKNLHPKPIDAAIVDTRLVHPLHISFQLDQKLSPLERKNKVLELYDKKLVNMFPREIDDFMIHEK